jgi:hypothetical protein
MHQFITIKCNCPGFSFINMKWYLIYNLMIKYMTFNDPSFISFKYGGSFRLGIYFSLEEYNKATHAYGGPRSFICMQTNTINMK